MITLTVVETRFSVIDDQSEITIHKISRTVDVDMYFRRFISQIADAAELWSDVK